MKTAGRTFVLCALLVVALAGGLRLTAAQLPLSPVCGLRLDYTPGEMSTVGAQGPVGIGVEPERCIVLHDDFLTLSQITAPGGTGTIIHSEHAWAFLGAVPGAASSPFGTVTIDGNGTQGVMRSAAGPSTLRLYTGLGNDDLRIRAAQLGAAAGTRRVGLGSAQLTVDPASGIYWRWTNGGEITAVCRDASTENTIGSGVNAANGVFHILRVTICCANTGTTMAEFFVDGVSIGTMSNTSFPTPDPCPYNVAMGFSAGAGSTASGTGLELDYISHIMRRHPRP